MKLTHLLLSLALSLQQSQAQVEDYQDDERNPEFVKFDKNLLTLSSFFEQFDDDDWNQVWKVSKAKKNDELYYTGEWLVEESNGVVGFTNDKGLVLKTPSAHHAISAELPSVFDNTNETLVLQYEVKLDRGLKCGGAYIKLLDTDANYEEFSDETPFQVMFGPDRCGPLNKIHLVIRHRDKKTGTVEEKHLQVPPPARISDMSTLYTLIIKPTQDFEIRVNGNVIKAGNLLDEYAFKPSFNPPKQIEDPSSTKPADWDDNEYIPDPAQTVKPDDWDEEAPYLIEDPNAIRPDTWDEDEPLYIPNPEATRPAEWNDEEDGTWIAPLIFNPNCLKHGCGPFKAEKIVNTAYRGKWVQPSIENPNYKGEWAPGMIANPNYHEDLAPSNLDPIGGIGFELWSVDNDILFDNIYLGHSIEDAELVGNETFTGKTIWERRDKELTERLRQKALRRSRLGLFPDRKGGESLSEYIEEVGEVLADYVADLIYDMIEDPVPVFTGRYYELLYVGLFMIFLCIAGFLFWDFVINKIEQLLSTGKLMPSQVRKQLTEKEEKDEDENEGHVEIIENAKTTGVKRVESEAFGRK